MASTLTRREALLALGASVGAARAASLTPTVESHVHLFDPARVPYAPDAPYKPAAYTLEDHLKLVGSGGLAHSIIVHPEPYQDDHRYVEYCLAHEPSRGYFKATCMFDPLREDTPGRMRELAGRWPKRIVALRIHEMSMTPESSGPIRNRDMKDPRMTACWSAVASLGIAVQMHFIPGQAAAIHRLAAQFSDTTVILDHMGRPGQGTDAEYDEVLKLAALPRVILKYSGWEYYKGDMGVLTRRLYDTFGPERMMWGMVGTTVADYQKQSARFDELLAFAPGGARAKIRGGNAQRLFFSE